MANELPKYGLITQRGTKVKWSPTSRVLNVHPDSAATAGIQSFNSIFFCLTFFQNKSGNKTVVSPIFVNAVSHSNENFSFK